MNNETTSHWLIAGMQTTHLAKKSYTGRESIIKFSHNSSSIARCHLDDSEYKLLIRPNG